MLEREIRSNYVKGTRNIVLYTDASKYAIRAVLDQEIPEVRNVLADFGTRQLDPDEWDEDSDDDDLYDFYTAAPFDIVTDAPDICMDYNSSTGFDELERYKFTHEERNGVIMIDQKSEWLTSVST